MWPTISVRILLNFKLFQVPGYQIRRIETVKRKEFEKLFPMLPEHRWVSTPIVQRFDELIGCVIQIVHRIDFRINEFIRSDRHAATVRCFQPVEIK